ncbi:MAG TPA: hypothetical protein VN739_02840 [Nitrososphaerales archaeon]|nr:hypothetical protein [Nitrososphaerales archaeon]
MPQVLVHLNDELVNEIRKIIKEKYGNRRGSLSIVVEEALKRSLEPPEEISASTLLEIIDYVSRASKEGQPKDQILTNVYLMLDRQFEQSILRGLEDMKKKGRTRKVPRNVDPIDFLKKLARETKKEN